MGSFDYGLAQIAGIKPNGLINGSSVLNITNGVGYPLDQCKGFAKQVQSGSVTAGVLKSVLSLSGKGALSFLGCAPANTTSRTHRLKVTLDGVVIFDATSAATTSETTQVCCAIGAIGSSTTVSFPIPDNLIFDKSLLIEYAGSLTETNGTYISYRYTPRA